MERTSGLQGPVLLQCYRVFVLWHDNPTKYSLKGAGERERSVVKFRVFLQIGVQICTGILRVTTMQWDISLFCFTQAARTFCPKNICCMFPRGQFHMNDQDSSSWAGKPGHNCTSLWQFHSTAFPPGRLQEVERGPVLHLCTALNASCEPNFQRLLWENTSPHPCLPSTWHNNPSDKNYAAIKTVLPPSHWGRVTKCSYPIPHTNAVPPV